MLLFMGTAAAAFLASLMLIWVDDLMADQD